MTRYVGLLSVLLTPLAACASSGPTNERPPGRQGVAYYVWCYETNPGFEYAIDCSYKVTYRSDYGTSVGRNRSGDGNWAGGWASASGDTAFMIVERTAGANSELRLEISVDQRLKIATKIMGEGVIGPVTLTAVVP